MHPSERGHGLRIATVRGVPVYLGTSWFFLAAALVMLTGSTYAELGPTAYLLGLARAIALLLAVLWHEVAHALVARRFGLRVHRIVATLMGGHTAFDGAGLTPRASGVVAASGPVANLALAALLWPLAGVTDGYLGWIVSGAAWTNLLLGLFNLVPGLPLDGGAILEAIVWRVTGRRHTGLAVAGWCGRVLAVAVLAVPVVALLAGYTTSTFGIVWGALLAMVLWQGASAALQHSRVRALVHGVRLDQIAVPARVLDAAAPLSALGPAGAAGVCVRDERGVPCLVLTDPSGLDPATPLSAALLRLPDAAVLEATPDADPLLVLATMQSNNEWPVVLVQGGQPWAVAYPQLAQAALARGPRPAN